MICSTFILIILYVHIYFVYSSRSLALSFSVFPSFETNTHTQTCAQHHVQPYCFHENEPRIHMIYIHIYINLQTTNKIQFDLNERRSRRDMSPQGRKRVAGMVARDYRTVSGIGQSYHNQVCTLAKLTHPSKICTRFSTHSVQTAQQVGEHSQFTIGNICAAQ